MSDDMTLEQVLCIDAKHACAYALHLSGCPLCLSGLRCKEVERQLRVLAKWAMISIQVQWREALSESEEAS